MAKHDYHMHPQLLTKPGDWADAFVRKAISEGIEEICFTDHMPLSMSDQKDRIPRGRVSEYYAKASEYADKYKDEISIKVGIEVDYHPDYLDEIEAVLQAGKFDYILGSSHLQLPGYGLKLGEMEADEFISVMLKNILGSVKSGYFDAVAHIDFYRWIVESEERFPMRTRKYHYENHRDTIAEILDEIKKRDMILEVNTHRMAGIGGLENVYPCRETLELSLLKGVKYRFGSDAHVPHDVGFGWNDLKQDPFYGIVLGQAERQW